MKIFLLNPPSKDDKKFIREGRCTQEQGVWATLWPPISLVTIGAVLEKDGHEVKVVDCAAQGVSWEELKQLIDKFLPHVIKYLPSQGSILEVGTSTGRYTPELAKRGYKLTAVGLSAAQIEECRKSIADEGLERQVRLVHRSIDTASEYWQEKVIREQQFFKCYGDPTQHAADRAVAWRLRRANHQGWLR